MIQLVVNTNLLREIDERRLINTYARLMYNEEKDTSDDETIRRNLESILDWDIRGDRGLAVYCNKFESLKRKDWEILIQFIKDNAFEIKNISYSYKKERKEMEKKIVLSKIELKEKHNKERASSENYQVSRRGKPAKPCIYEGRYYKSRYECRYKEGISQNKLYRYLEKTGQI